MGLFTGNGIRGHLDKSPSHDEKPERPTEDTECNGGGNTPEGGEKASQGTVDTDRAQSDSQINNTMSNEAHGEESNGKSDNVESENNHTKNDESDKPPLWVKIVGNISTAAIGVALIMGGFVFYQTTYSNWVNQREQQELIKSLGVDQWESNTIVVDNPEPEKLDITEGEAWATISIPSIDSTHAIVGGIRKEDLDKGPGYFMDTAKPGEEGNLSLAGHRIGKGAPFNRLDELTTCDTITIETEKRIYTYQVLPTNGDQAECLTEKDRQQWESIEKPQGSNIVKPTDVGVVAPNPYVESQNQEEITDQGNMKLLTLVTCNPEWGNWERLIIHATHTQTEVKQ